MNLGIARQELAGISRAPREILRARAQIVPDLGDVIYNLASVLEQQGEKEEVERLYVKPCSAESGMGRRPVPSGLPAARNAPIIAARRRLSSACAASRSPWPEVQLNLGLAYWNIGDQEGAAKAFEGVLESDPHSIDALRGLAALAVEREELDKALDLQAKLIEAGERTPELFYNTGLLLQKAGQTDDAIRLYQEALAERPNFAEALLNLGHALKSKGDVDQARNYWKQALEQKPELAAGYFEQ